VAAVLLAGGSSRAMLASARLSCCSRDDVFDVFKTFSFEKNAYLNVFYFLRRERSFGATTEKSNILAGSANDRLLRRGILFTQTCNTGWNACVRAAATRSLRLFL